MGTRSQLSLVWHPRSGAVYSGTPVCCTRWGTPPLSQLSGCPVVTGRPATACWRGPTATVRFQRCRRSAGLSHRGHAVTSADSSRVLSHAWRRPWVALSSRWPDCRCWQHHLALGTVAAWLTVQRRRYRNCTASLARVTVGQSSSIGLSELSLLIVAVHQLHHVGLSCLSSPSRTSTSCNTMDCLYRRSRPCISIVIALGATAAATRLSVSPLDALPGCRLSPLSDFRLVLSSGANSISLRGWGVPMCIYRESKQGQICRYY